jgi:hypothetical protein
LPYDFAVFSIGINLELYPSPLMLGLVM